MWKKWSAFALLAALVLAPLSACTGPQPQLLCTTPTCPIAHWPMNEGTGAALVKDVVASPIFNHGFAWPGVVQAWPGFNGPTSVTGQVGGALYFPGNGANKVMVPSTSDLNLGYGSLYLEAYVAPVQCGANAYYPILDKWDATGQNGYTFYLEGVGSGQVRAALRLGGGTFTSTQTFPANFQPPSAGTWTQVAVKVDGTSGVFYVNGSPAGTFTAPSGSTSNTLPLWLGALHTPPAGGVIHCEIALDEVKVGKVNPIFSGQ